MSGARSLKRLFLLLGDPVHHSLSPALHNAAFGELGIDAAYVTLRAPDQLVEPLMHEVGQAGGGGNVTVPHKRRAALALDAASDAVHVTGACNVFWWRAREGLCGDNTDVEAFRVAAETLMGSSLQARRILVLGAGGAARAVVYGCVQRGAAAIDIVNRTPEQAESLVRDLAEPPGVSVLSDGPARDRDGYDLIVNATSLGLDPSDPLPLDLARARGAAVLDLAYGPEETPLVRAARDAGIRAEDGRRMLVEGAAASFRLWWDREPPIESMYEAAGVHRDRRA